MTTDPTPIDITPPAQNSLPEAAKLAAQRRKEDEDFRAELAANAAKHEAQRAAEDKKRQAEELAARLANTASLYYKGTMTERADLLIGLLTNLATESILLADGNCPELTEQGYAELKERAARWSNGNMPEPPRFTGSVTPYLAARSANLRDAVRVSEAVARLMTSHTRVRQAQAPQTVATVDEWQDGDKRRRRVRSMTRFGLGPDDVVLEAAAVRQTETDTETASA
jgi:hypothetical protein